MWLGMKKRLFCVLLAVSMIGSSLTVHAAETDDRLIAVSSVREGQADVTGEIQKTDENEGEETVPEGDAISEAEPEMTPETEPSDVPGEEQPEATPVSEPAEIPGEEPVETPEEIPSELPTETPSEEPEELVEVTPTGIPTEEPEATPVIEPEEIPEGSPSPDMLVTPGIMSFSEDGIGVIMEDEGLLGAAAWTSGYLTESTAYVYTGDSGKIMTRTIKGDSNKEVGVNSGVIMRLDRYRIKTNKASFRCKGTIAVEREESDNQPTTDINSYISLAEAGWTFTLENEGTINVGEGLVLTIEYGNAIFNGTINLEPNAKLIVNNSATFNNAKINLSEGATLQVGATNKDATATFSGSTTIKTTGTGNIKWRSVSFTNTGMINLEDNAQLVLDQALFSRGTVNLGSHTELIVTNVANFNGTNINLNENATVQLKGNSIFRSSGKINATGSGTNIVVDGDLASIGSVTLEGESPVLTVNKAARFYGAFKMSGDALVQVAGDAQCEPSTFKVDASDNNIIRVEGECGDFGTITITGSDSVLTIDGDAGFADEIKLSDNSTVRVTGNAKFGYYSSISGQGTVAVKEYIYDTDGRYAQFPVEENIILDIENRLSVSGGGSLTMQGKGSINFGDGCEVPIDDSITLAIGTKMSVSDSGILTVKGAGELSFTDICEILTGTVRIEDSLPFDYETLVVRNGGRLELKASDETGISVPDEGKLHIIGGTVFIDGNLFMGAEEAGQNINTRASSDTDTVSILISDGGRLEVGTSAKPGNLTQKQGDIQITGGTVSVAGDYLLTGGAAADINADGTFTVGGKTELTSGSIAVGEGSRLETGTAQKPGNLSHGKGTLNINGGTVHVTGNHNMSAGSVLDLGAGSTLEVDGDFVRNSGKSCSYTEGTIKAGNNVELKDSFSGTGNFRLVMNGKDGQKIISEKSGNKLNLQLEGRNVTTVGDFGATVYSGGTITPDKGTFAATSLKVEECGLKVNGNVEATGRVEVGGKSGSLEVTGNYIQPSDSLKLSGGEVIIGGDYRIQKKAGEGYGAGTGGLIMDNPNPKEPSTSKLTVNGTLYMESPNVSRNSFWGTMTVKGNIEQKKAGGFDKFEGYKDFRLVLAGDGPQTVSLESEGNVLNELELINDKVTIKGYLNAKLAADGSITLPSDGTLEITGLELQGYELTVKGGKDSVVKASGNVDLGGASGHLVIPGDYVQSSGALRIGEGTMEVGNDLLVLDRDNDGKDKTGEGYLSMTGSKGELIVQGDLTVQSRRNSTFSSGTLMLSGDLVQRKGEDGRGTGYINATSTSHKVILAGEGSQNIVFDNEKNKLGTLQLTKDKSEYGFDPDKISMKVTTGPAPEPPSRPLPSGWPFSDVPVASGNWRYDSVKFVYDNGVMNGISGTDRFAPDEPLTRGMFATVLYRIAGEPDVDFENRFSDVSDGRYYSKAVIWAYSRGIVQGIGGGKLFGTEEYITREQIAKMLYEFGRVQGCAMGESADLGEFPDNGDVSGWAVDYMKWAVGSGMINGKNIDGSHYLDPKGNATRVECAAMLTRFMKKYL